jgi:hypothetical protein
MLIDIWERLRGYDKWVQTEARIESSDLTKIPLADRSGNVVGYNYKAGDVVTWVDGSGERQYATFDVEEASPLFQLVGNESVTIRYDPAHPDRFYYRELLKSQVKSFFRTALGLLALVGFLVFAAWARLGSSR